MELVPRHLEREVREAIADTRVVVIAGPRQAGKSTLARAAVASDSVRRIVTLDDAATFDAAKADPTGFIDDLRKPGALIDEVHRVPELLLEIKRAVDRDNRPGQFVLTGSANLLTSPRVLDSLAGRVQMIELDPLSEGELRRVRERFIDRLFVSSAPDTPTSPPGLDEYLDIACAGGFPEVRLRRESTRRRGAWLSEYVRTVVGRDVLDIRDVHRTSVLPDLLTVVAAATCSTLTLEGVSRDLRIDSRTLRSYLQLLETAYMVRPLQAWQRGVAPRVVKSRKWHVIDSGLLAHLLHTNPDAARQDGDVQGKLLETVVVNELRKQLGWSETPAKMYHYRDRDGYEVDIVLEAPDRSIVGIEVKATRTARADLARSLKRLARLAGDRFVAGVVLHCGESVIRHDDRIWSAPIASLWQGDEFQPGG